MSKNSDRARAALLERERRQTVFFIKEFRKLQIRLESDIDATLKAIDEQKAAGEIKGSTIARNLRLNEFLKQIKEEIRAMSATLAAVVENGQRSGVKIAKDQAAGNPQISTGLNYFDSDAAKEFVGFAGDGSPLRSIFDKLADPVADSVIAELANGIATGLSNAAIAKNINDAVGRGTVNAMTIARTETNRAYREASRKYYSTVPGVIGWRWMSALDLRTCVICWSHHGRVFKTSQKMGTHPNCRCVMVPVFEGEPQVETGSKLFGKLTPAQQKTILGPRRMDLYNDGARLADFVGTYKNKFGTGRRIKPLVQTTYKPRPRTGEALPAPIIKPAPVPPVVTPETALPDVVDYNFATIQAAENYAEAKYPGKTFDFGKMHITGVRETVKEFDRLADEWPEVAARLRYIGTFDTKPVFINPKVTIDPKNKPHLYRNFFKFSKGEVAHATRDGYRIALNPAFYKDPKALADLIIDRKKSGWFASGRPESMFTHEFGHQIDNYLETLGGHAVTDFVSGSGGGSFGSLYRALKSKLRGLERVSRYGKTNTAELMAETFSATVGQPKHEAAQAYKQFLDGFRKLKLRPPGEFKDFTQATEKEAAAFRAEYRKILEILGL